MGSVRASVEIPDQASVAEDLWYDSQRWASFIDGLGHVQRVDDSWPREGASVIWDSKPGGRGRVLERVLEYEARVGQTLAVEDEKINGRQRVEFKPHEGGCTVTLALDYDIKQERGVTAVVDLVFVRRPMRDSLKRTLIRFRRELAADREHIL